MGMLKVKDHVPDFVRILHGRLFIHLPNVIDLNIRHAVPVILYLPPKVGSTSVARVLKNNYRFSMRHHYLRPEITDWVLNRYKKELPLHYWNFKRQRWAYDKIVVPKRPVKFITMVRDPIAQGVSNFFDTLDRIMLKPESYKDYTVPELIDLFFAQDFREISWLHWFDDELMPTLGIDLYKYDFPREAGYLRIQEGNIDLLLMKTELKDDVKAKIVMDFVGLDKTISLAQHLQVTADKSYGEIYDVFKKTLVLPPELIHNVYNSPIVKYFYTDEELKRFETKWLSRNEKSQSGQSTA